ncbi:MAG: glycosyltransferase [Nitrospirota bacterium]
MRAVMFYHSVVSDWNHRDAHFLRGVVTEMMARGHDVTVFEPKDGWSRQCLITEHGREALRKFRRAYPHISYSYYNTDNINLDDALDGAELVMVHERSERALVSKIGEHRKKKGRYKLLFHDAHRRTLARPDSMPGFDLSGYDGVLAYGAAIRDLYLSRGWARDAWVWREAADVRIFRPLNDKEPWGDVVFIGDWGAGERQAGILEFLALPVKALGLKARVYGVGYPEEAKRELLKAGIEYGGWLPNFEVPQVFSRYKMTIHIPERPYSSALAGIPTIEPFEALACGIPMISAPWNESEGLFAEGQDYLGAKDGKEMTALMAELTADPHLRERLSEHGLMTVLTRHTCGHRVNELMNVLMKVSGACRVARVKKVVGEKRLASAR